jgi:hypothetical protein
MANITLEEDEVVTPQTNNAELNQADFDVDFGDENMMTKGDGFDKIQPPENAKDRVVRAALLADIVKPKKAWIHFVTNKGSFLCISERDEKTGNVKKQGVCCKALENDEKQRAQLIVGVLGLHYVNADHTSGKYAQGVPIEYKIGWVKLSRSGFRRVSLLIPEDAKVHDIDIVISWKTNGIGFEYNLITQKCRFRQNPELLKEVLDQAKAEYGDGVKLVKKLGKKLTELEWRALLSGKGASSSSEAKVDNLADLD